MEQYSNTNIVSDHLTLTVPNFARNSRNGVAETQHRLQAQTGRLRAKFKERHEALEAALQDAMAELDM